MEKRAVAVMEAEKSSSAGGRSSEKHGSVYRFFQFILSNLLMILLMSGILLGAGALLAALFPRLPRSVPPRCRLGASAFARFTICRFTGIHRS